MDELLQIRIDKGLKKEINAVRGELSISEYVRRSVLKELSRYYIEKENEEKCMEKM